MDRGPDVDVELVRPDQGAPGRVVRSTRRLAVHARQRALQVARRGTRGTSEWGTSGRGPHRRMVRSIRRHPTRAQSGVDDGGPASNDDLVPALGRSPATYVRG